MVFCFSDTVLLYTKISRIRYWWWFRLSFSNLVTIYDWRTLQVQLLISVCFFPPLTFCLLFVFLYHSLSTVYNKRVLLQIKAFFNAG